MRIFDISFIKIASLRVRVICNNLEPFFRVAALTMHWPVVL